MRAQETFSTKSAIVQRTARTYGQLGMVAEDKGGPPWSIGVDRPDLPSLAMDHEPSRI